MKALVNIGLAYSLTSDLAGASMTPENALRALRLWGAKVTRHALHESDTEATLVAELAAPLSRDHLKGLSVGLRQDCIAQYANGKGDLEGPKAADWGPFNPEYFLTMEGQRLAVPVAA